VSALLRKRFAELSAQLSEVEATKQQRQEGTAVLTYVDDDKLLNWRVKARSLIATACGKDSEHFAAFEKAEEVFIYTTNHSVLRRVQAVFEAAREDFEGGYVTSVRNLVQAEVFDSELEQAGELLSSGYAQAAAVVAGVVLETTLRELCDRRQIPHGKLDKMNADLAKAGAYNVLVQKRITSLAAIRNSAAHGKIAEFTSSDVVAMLEDVRRLLGEHLS